MAKRKVDLLVVGRDELNYYVKTRTTDQDGYFFRCQASSEEKKAVLRKIKELLTQYDVPVELGNNLSEEESLEWKELLRCLN